MQLTGPGYQSQKELEHKLINGPKVRAKTANGQKEPRRFRLSQQNIFYNKKHEIKDNVELVEETYKI